VWFVGDAPLPFGETWPRLRKRVDYALTGTWTAPPPLKKNGKPTIPPLRLAYLLLYTLPIACPIAIALDLADWATHPAGRLAVTAVVLWLLHII
jgi:hypothetical protein